MMKSDFCSKYGIHVLLPSNCTKFLIHVDSNYMDVIDSMNLNFYVGSAVKIIWECGKSKPLFDITRNSILKNCELAIFYLEYHTQLCEKFDIEPEDYICVLINGLFNLILTIRLGEV